MTDTVDPRRVALRAEISQLFRRAEAPGIDQTEAQTRTAAAVALTAVLTGSEPAAFVDAIGSTADTEPDVTVAAHLREVAANLPRDNADLVTEFVGGAESEYVMHIGPIRRGKAARSWPGQGARS